MNGIVKSIFICSRAGEPMQAVNAVEALQGLGLKGDRYAIHTGFWQNVSKPRPVIRHVSLIRAEDIEPSGFLAHETRRNIVVSTDFRLVDLIGKKFLIGEVEFLGAEDCTPCKRPSQLVSRSGFESAFFEKGGLRAEVLKSGHIRTGDSLRIL